MAVIAAPAEAVTVIVNEVAPRTHNSGHHTIEACVTDQFEQHLRAILDLPLGSTDMRGEAGMVNLIGRIPDDREPLDTPPCHLHDYGKAPRAGRKLGHINVLTDNRAERGAAFCTLATLVTDDGAKECAPRAT